jgi:hypothetical protein
VDPVSQELLFAAAHAVAIFDWIACLHSHTPPFFGNETSVWQRNGNETGNETGNEDATSK